MHLLVCKSSPESSPSKGEFVKAAASFQANFWNYIEFFLSIFFLEVKAARRAAEQAVTKLIFCSSMYIHRS